MIFITSAITAIGGKIGQALETAKPEPFSMVDVAKEKLYFLKITLYICEKLWYTYYSIMRRGQFYEKNYG